jgi:hypothetical protein
MARDHAIVALILAPLLVGAGCSHPQRYSDIRTPTPLAKNDTLIIGFLGGRNSFRNTKIGVSRLAIDLRRQLSPSVHIETVENQQRGVAMQVVQKGLDRNGNGRLDESERRSARIILYGQSFGGAAVVKFARQLDAIGVPVMLSVQVDSVGRNDELVPPNVRKAANFYQANGFIIRGAQRVRASDPECTTVLFNRRFDYRGHYEQVRKFPWYLEPFQTVHMRMDNDPEVWSQVERLILETIKEERR